MSDQYHDRPFPPEQDSNRVRQHGESDPLAELARLIGQTDPFSNFAQSAAPQTPSSQYRLPTPVALENEAPPLPSWMQHRHAQAQPQAAADPYQHEAPSFIRTAAEQHPQDRYDDALYGADPSRAAADDSYDSYPTAPYGYQDEYAEGEPPVLKPKRAGMMTVVAVLALGVVGTGAAFGYRTYVGSRSSGEPPVIKADTGPTKMIPAPASGDAAGKAIQDRLAAGNGTEAIVSREEQPLDPAKAGPRVVLPQTNQSPNPAAAVAPPPRPLVTPSAAVTADEPRKIRTLTVRPDAADPAATPVTKQSAQARAPVAAPRAQAPAPVANANALANAPLSLSPQAAQANTRVASAPPSAQPAATASGGSYVVQVSSQKSESDAQASYRTLQGKFPGVLGSHPPLIRRADLGSKGVFYRAMVGPFGTSDEAAQFCGNLKTAGGQCVVQRN